MKRIIATLPYVLALFFVVGLATNTTQAFSGKGFSERDVKGEYGVAFDGTLTPVGENTGPQPVASVGQLNADGKGNADFVRTLNIGGLILEQTGIGTYTVEPNGIGTAEFDVTLVFPEGAFPNTIETFRFVVINNKKILFIGLTIERIEGNMTFPVGNGAIRGVARKQKR